MNPFAGVRRGRHTTPSGRIVGEYSLSHMYLDRGGDTRQGDYYTMLDTTRIDELMPSIRPFVNLFDELIVNSSKDELTSWFLTNWCRSGKNKRFANRRNSWNWVDSAPYLPHSILFSGVGRPFEICENKWRFEVSIRHQFANWYNSSRRIDELPNIVRYTNK